MNQISIRGTRVATSGTLPTIGSGIAPFCLTRTDMTDITPDEFTGKALVLNIFPSVDTGVCAASVRRFNTEVAKLENTVVLCVSLDLPFAHARFCEAEGITGVIPVSAFRHPDFLEKTAVMIAEGPLKGLPARQVVVLDAGGTVIHSELVPELGQEPDYNAVLDALSRVTGPRPGAEPVEQVPLAPCTTTATAESARLFETDEPCNDGRAG
ncbi:thiol peroxidase [Desulfatiferula olefinivorans]